MGKEPIPCLNDVFPYVILEEGRRDVMIGNGSQGVSALQIEYEGDQKKAWQMV